ncbi:MAG: hypothetical protein A2Y60_06105 [Chloroflexi bacterium RBG_13_54_9]|nr:MAG: hypothetical protein A2Y60_06105 [Chloroflexi bacterium RBG_13_54_9]
MKAAILVGPQKIEVKDVPAPKPGPGEVVVRVRACAVCGSDLAIFMWGPGVLGVEQRIMGHEFSGDIAEIGEGVEGWNVGDRVVIEPTVACLKCHYCTRHQYNRCLSVGSDGIVIDGAFAEFVKVPAYQLHRLPDEVSYAEGALIEPLAVALHGIWRSGMKPGDTVAVLGAGPIGLLTMLWARKGGASKVFATEIAERRSANAKVLADVVLNPSQTDIVSEIIAQTDGLGPDIIFECSGNATAQVQALTLVRKGGRVVVLGVGHENTPMPSHLVLTREITIIGSHAYASLLGNGEFPKCIEFVRSRRIDLSLISTTRIRLDDVAEKGFMGSTEDRGGKVIIEL